MIVKIHFSLLLIYCISICAQNLSIANISEVRIVSLSNSGSVVAQIPHSHPGLLNSKSYGKENKDNPLIFNWILKFTAGNKVFKDISFANTQVGYIVTELGAVYKSSNGGDNWVSVMNLGFPYYWYGVHALSPDTVVIAGFNNQGQITTGVVRWSFNGGTTWTNDIILHRQGNGVGWLDRVHFFNQNTGIVLNGLSGACFYTTNGGKDSNSWTFVQVDPTSGWFAGNADFQSSGRVYAAGISFCKSTNFGLNWTTGPSADNVFDGGVDFLDYNSQFGWTGGGQISAPVSGWTHRTTDGGSTWGPRQNTFAYPIRGVYFFNENSGFAIGGNLYQDAGGIYSTSNAGTNWNHDVSTSAEMFSLEYKLISPDSIDVWCVGSTGGSTGFTGKLYKARIQNILGVTQVNSQIPADFKLYQNYPNPFNPATMIKFEIPNTKFETKVKTEIRIYDVIGKEVAILVNEELQPGTYQISFDAKHLSSGVYFYRLNSGDFTSVKKMILVK